MARTNLSRIASWYSCIKVKVYYYVIGGLAVIALLACARPMVIAKRLRQTSSVEGSGQTMHRFAAPHPSNQTHDGGIRVPLRYDLALCPFIIVDARINGHVLPFALDTG